MIQSKAHAERAKPCSFCSVDPTFCPHLGPICRDVWRDADDVGAVPVVAAVLMRERSVLLCKRPAHKRHGGLWEFPGGKLLPGETLGEGMQRELREELQLELTGPLAYLGREQDPDSAFVLHFVAAHATGDPASVEHDEVTWVAPVEMDGLELAPGDRTFVEAWRAGSPKTF